MGLEQVSYITDRVLYQRLYFIQDSAYITEVHHINGEGEDAGVVYCEMQARENTSEDLTHYRLVQLMYPGHCGYKVREMKVPVLRVLS